MKTRESLASVQMNHLLSQILSKSDPSQVAGLSRFFKTGPGQYGEGDKFLGIKVPTTREVVKACWRQTGFEELEECIRSEFHEVRLAALLTLVQIFTHARKDAALQQQCIDFYLSHTEFVNNWDLVDLSCYELLGRWLLEAETGSGSDASPEERQDCHCSADCHCSRDRRLLYDLARGGRTIWEQRIGIVSSMQFVRHGQLDDTYAIADIFLDKPQPLHDLLQKAVGWLLREAGKRDVDRLRHYLAANSAKMPRTMLHYAIEKFPPAGRRELLNTRESLASVQIRAAKNDDIPRIMEICAQARGIMRADGNMNQWTGGYPSEDVIRADINASVGQVIEVCGRLEGYFAFIPGIESTYLRIEGGRWLDDSEPYCTIHRLASTRASHGIARACFEWCWEQCRNLRIDTHEDNRIMRHCIEAFGFSYCGVIHILNGDPRLAYQKLNTRESLACVQKRSISCSLTNESKRAVASLK